MDSTSIKIIVSAVFFFSTIICSLIPVGVTFWIRKRAQSNISSSSSGQSRVKGVSKKILTSCITCFGGGVFLGACLLDLLPDVIHDINTTLKNEFNYDNEHENNYPFGEILIGFGLFIVLFVEQTILSFQSSTKNSISIPNKTSSLIVSHNDNEITVDSNKNEQFLLMTTENSCSTIEHQISLNDSKCNTPTNVNDLTTTRNFLMILSLVIHSIFEGVAIGSLNEYQTIMQLSLAILIHKSIISFSVGLKFISTTKKRSTYLSFIIFASATPIGILLMLSMQEFLPNNRSTKIVNDILRGFACGTFFYITFFDVLPHELNISSKLTGTSFISKAHRLIKTFCVLIGFTFISILLIITK